MSTKHIIKVLILSLFAIVNLNGCVTATENDDVASVEQEVVAIPPPPPTNLVATIVSSTRVTLTWDPVPNAQVYVIMKGTASGNETSYTTWPGTSTTFTDGYLTPGATYSWQVKVAVANEVSGPSNEQITVMPGSTIAVAPTGMTANATSSSRIALSWDTHPSAAKYYLYQQSTVGGSFNYLATVVAPTTTYVVGGLMASTTYSFYVVAQNSEGSSPPSAAASATTFSAGLESYWTFDEDTGSTAADSSGFGRTATLSGGAAFSNDKAPIIDNKSAVTFPSSTAVATVANSASFALFGDFTISMWVKLVAAPTGAVHLLGQRAAGCGALGWELAQDATNQLHMNGVAPLSFGQSLPVGTWTHVAVTSTGGTAQLYINGAQVATGAYSPGPRQAVPLQIGNAGTCAQGAGHLIDELRLYSRGLAASEVATQGTLPPAPTNLVATNVNSAQQDLAWVAGAGAQKYLIYKGTASNNQTFLTSWPATTSTYSDGHLMPSTQYSWKVRVVRNNLISNFSNEQVLTTLPAPGAPTNVTAIAASSSRIDVAWSAVTGAVKYYVFQAANGSATYTFKGTTVSTTFAASGLTANTAYSYKVQAIDSGNSAGAFSTPASATTLP